MLLKLTKPILTFSILLLAAIMFSGCGDKESKVAQSEQAPIVQKFVPPSNNEGVIAFDAVPESFEKVSDGLYRSELAVPSNGTNETQASNF